MSGFISNVSNDSRDFTATIFGRLSRCPNFPQNEFRQSLATDGNPGFLVTL